MAPLPSSTTTTLENTLGAAFLGVVGASMLSGSTFAQTYIYYHNYPYDTILNKCAVGILWFLDTLHLALVVHAVYFYNVTEYGNILALQTIPLSMKLQALINVLIVLLVHSLYARRVWILGGYHKGILGYFVAFVVAGGAAVGFVLMHIIFRSQTFTELEESAWAVYAALGTATSIDFVIAAAMCYYLRKSQGSVMRLNSRISKVIQYMISSGLFTSACSLAAMFSYILMPNTYICISLAFLVTKLYAGSFLAMLNSRERTNKRVSELFTSKNSWRRSLKIVSNSSASLFGPRSDMSGEATIQFPEKPAFLSQSSAHHCSSI